MNIDEIDRLVSILEGTGVSEFEFEKDGVTLRICRSLSQQSVVTHGVTQPIISAATPAVSNAEPTKVIDDTAGLIKVESPIVGTFYRKPSPDAANFVEVGARVKKGDRLCIIEAMKLMNEIEAPAAGTIEKVFVSESSVVEFGELLFLIRP